MLVIGGFEEMVDVCGVLYLVKFGKDIIKIIL